MDKCKSKIIKGAALLIISFSALNIQAQTKELTLKEAVNYALENKSEAIKAKLDVENSKYQIQEARSAALPNISANGNLTYNAIIQQAALNMGGQTVIIRMGQPWQTNATIGLDQQIFNLAVFTGLKAAKTTREFYQLNANLTEEQVIEKVANSYYEVFRLKSQTKTLERTIENTSRIKNVISSLYENGLATKIDLDRTNVSLNNLQSTRQQLINMQQLQENSLKYLIGMYINTAIALPEDTFTISEHSFVTDDLNLENRTEIKLMETQIQLLRLNKKATEAQGYPTLGLTANYGYLGLGEQFPWFASGNGVNWSDFSAIGLNLSVPIFKGGSIKAKASQNQIEIEKAEADMKDTRLALDLAYNNAVNQINNSLITLNTQKENVNLAQEVLTNIENNYKNGLATLTDLLDAENSYSESQNNYTNSMLDYKLAEIQLIKAKGELNTFK